MSDDKPGIKYSVGEEEKKFEALIGESIGATKALNSKIIQVAGQGGILQRLNEAHINSLNELVKNPQNKGAISRISTLLKREEKVLYICQKGLKQYEVILKSLESEAGKFFKRKIVKDISFLLGVVEKIRVRILKLLRRVEIERKVVIDTSYGVKPGRIQKIINALKKEDRDIRRLIRRSKPSKLSALRTMYLGMKDVQAGTVEKARMFKSVIKDSSVRGISAKTGKKLGVIIIGFIFIIAIIIEALLRILFGFLESDKELQAEIRNLKRAT